MFLAAHCSCCPCSFPILPLLRKKAHRTSSLDKWFATPSSLSWWSHEIHNETRWVYVVKTNQTKTPSPNIGQETLPSTLPKQASNTRGTNARNLSLPDRISFLTACYPCYPCLTNFEGWDSAMALSAKAAQTWLHHRLWKHMASKHIPAYNQEQLSQYILKICPFKIFSKFWVFFEKVYFPYFGHKIFPFPQKYTVIILFPKLVKMFQYFRL